MNLLTVFYLLDISIIYFIYFIYFIYLSSLSFGTVFPFFYLLSILSNYYTIYSILTNVFCFYSLIPYILIIILSGSSLFLRIVIIIFYIFLSIFDNYWNNCRCYYINYIRLHLFFINIDFILYYLYYYVNFNVGNDKCHKFDSPNSCIFYYLIWDGVNTNIILVIEFNIVYSVILMYTVLFFTYTSFIINGLSFFIIIEFAFTINPIYPFNIH